MRVSRLTILILLSAAACSGADKAKTAETEQAVEQAGPETTETTEAPEDQGEGVAWKDKTHEQQEAYMKATVKPHMKQLFVEFDAEKFSEFRCSTCHGKDAAQRHFEMPNPDLPKLSDWEKLEAEQPEMMEFMKTKVVPEMAKLLDQEPFNPETKTGFGCSGCHTR